MAGAIGLATVLLGAAVSALLLVPLQRTTHAAPKAHRGVSAVTTPTLTLPPAPSTTVPDTTPQPATAAGGSGGLGGVGVTYGPANIVDPSPVATATVASLPLYSSPGGAQVGHLSNPNWLGAPLTLLVTAFQGDWVQAYVPQRPNESAAWFPRADVAISSDPYHIVVTISAHQLVLYKDNAPVFTTQVATGAPDSPTPTGSYFVAFIVKLTDPQDAYGPYALGTSAFSNTYYSFEGGPGQVGIHGTNQPWVIGEYASHGCIRLKNDAITTLASQIPPGTPVEIGP